MNRPLADIPITKTLPGLTPKEIAVAVIADKLGIPENQVTDKTPLGDAWHEVAPVIAIKTGKIIVSNVGMKAKDIFEQL